jgi:hypothetical protein
VLFFEELTWGFHGKPHQGSNGALPEMRFDTSSTAKNGRFRIIGAVDRIRNVPVQQLPPPLSAISWLDAPSYTDIDVRRFRRSFDARHVGGCQSHVTLAFRGRPGLPTSK